jgi:glucosamine-6-phosphate deaminase
MQAGLLNVRVFAGAAELGAAAAGAVAAEMRRLIDSRGRAVGLFASAVSQSRTLATLHRAMEIDWPCLTVFHLDEYLGFDDHHPQSFRRFLREHLVSRVRLGAFHGLRGEAQDAAAECERYAALLRAAPPDFALLGIGENGHLAFNDPPVADFEDPLDVKIVELDARCRQQQVNDGAFATLDDVPRRALTLTIPAIMRVPKLFVVVPGERKRQAVEAALFGPASTACPASILRTHPDACLFLDPGSAPLR